MFKILATVVNEGKKNDKFQLRILACVDSASELVTSLDDKEFTQGSIAWDISTGDIYGLTNNTWVKQ